MPAAPAAPPAPPPPASAGRPARPGLLWLLALAAFTFAAFRPTDSVVGVSLDESNVASYAWFTAHGRHFGSEVISAVGPYGFVHYGYGYAGELYWVRFALELIVKAAFAALVLRFFRQSAVRGWRWPWLLAVLAITPLVEDTVYDVCLLLGGLFLLDRAARPRPGLAAHGVAALLAFLSLIKATQITLALAAIGLCALGALLARNLRRALALVGTFAASLILFWLLARQNLFDLPAFFRGAGELSAGFNLAMGLDERPAMTLRGVTLLAALLATCGAMVVLGDSARRRALPALWLAGCTFLAWKHGFVRADAHVMFFFDFALVSALVPLLLAGADTGAGRSRLVVPGLAAVAFSLAVVAVFGSRSPGAWLDAFRRAPQNRAAQLLHPVRQQAQLDARLDVLRQRYALPRLRERIGDHTVDFFGYQHGYIPLNRLAYHPRPMGGGSFNVYNEYLKRRNEAFLLDPTRRPDFYLLKIDRLDQHLVSQEDSRTLLQLLFLYRPVATEWPLFLLEKRPAAAAHPAGQPILVQRREFHWDEAIDLPAPTAGSRELLLASFQMAPSWWGRLRAFFYKPPEVFLHLTGDPTIVLPDVRLVPAMAGSPIILNPLIETSRDFIQLSTDMPGKAIRQFRVTSPRPAAFASERLAVTFYRLPLPPPDASASDVMAASHFPVANRIPQSDEHNSAPHPVDGELADSFHPPARVSFRLDGHERAASLRFGLEAGAYLGGETDGADVVLELLRPEETAPHILFRRHLNPKEVPGDRGTQSARVPLPLIRPGSLLTLRSDPGPAGNRAWDWVYVAQCDIAAGPLPLDRFPGFQIAPSLVDSPFAEATETPEGVHVFSLNAPGRLVFTLTGGERTFSFTGGMMPGAFSPGGRSDGAVFVVALHSAGAPDQTLLDYSIRPPVATGDVLSRAFQLTLPPHRSGDQLILLTEPGPAADRSWDWTYLTNVRID